MAKTRAITEMTPGMPKRVRSVENIESLSLSREPLCPPLPLAASSRLGCVPVVLPASPSKTMIDTVNEDFHKVKRGVFVRKKIVSRGRRGDPLEFVCGGAPALGHAPAREGDHRRDPRPCRVRRRG